jgi:sorbitol/mannitol transport system substrate-binding protein
MIQKRSSRIVRLGAVALSGALALTACAGAGGGPSGDAEGEDVTLTLATVNNPQMKDMEELKSQFESTHDGIKVKFIQMEENDLRDAVTKDVATQGGQYDIITIGSYEVPIWGENGWLTDLAPMAAEDTEYDVDDLFEPVRKSVSVDDKMFAAPFYGESSFLMYRKDLFKEAGLEMPAEPTWDEVAGFARELDGEDQAGICLRGKPGWGEFFAPATTVVNTFGGQWYDEEWNAQVTGDGFREAMDFYTGLIKDAGQSDPASFGFTECLNLFSQGNAAMWYDATVAAGLLEDPESSEVAGKIGYAHAPVKETEEAGWLWAWNLAVPATSEKQEAAWEFIRWATSKEYIELVGEELGWSRVPPGTRNSTYELDKYMEAGAAFAPVTRDIMLSVDPAKPGIHEQPWVGVQYVAIPEFQDVGNRVSQKLVDVLAGRSTLDEALESGQEIAQKAGEAQK